MSSPERRKQLEAEWAIEQEKASDERNRRAKLTIYDRIEEFVDDEELKNILHKIAEQCGLEN